MTMQVIIHKSRFKLDLPNPKSDLSATEVIHHLAITIAASFLHALGQRNERQNKLFNFLIGSLASAYLLN